MSDSEDSTVTYTTVSSPYEGRPGDVSPGVDGPPVMPEDPYVYVVAAFQALPPPDYVPGPDEPEQAPPSPVYIPYVPEPVYPEYIPLEDDVFPLCAWPQGTRAGTTLTRYIPESDLDEDLEEDDDKDPEEDPANHDDEEEEEPFGDDADEEDEEQDEDDDDEEEEHPALADSIPPPPPTPSITPGDRPEVTLPPRKRLSIVHCSRYEVGESSIAAAARSIEGRRAGYRFVNSLEAEIRRRRAEDIGYGIRDTWIDPRDVAKEEALTNLEGVNTRVTELAAVQE
nr:hypothetical protein [Tanacetum cinerariifolium]